MQAPSSVVGRERASDTVRSMTLGGQKREMLSSSLSFSLPHRSLSPAMTQRLSHSGCGDLSKPEGGEDPLEREREA